MSRRHDLHQSCCTACDNHVEIAFNHSFEGWGRRPLRMLRRECLDAIEREGELHVDRLLGPKRPVVVEHRDSLGGDTNSGVP